VVALSARGAPKSFTCESASGALTTHRVASNVVLTTGLLDANVARLDIGARPVVARSAESSVRADDGGTLRAWVVPIRSKTSVFDVVFRGKTGRPLGAVGVICTRKPALCHERPAAPPKHRLTLVTASGRQREVAVSEIPCGPNSGCSGSVLYVPGTAPMRASVVRPGERLRIPGIGQDPFANLSVAPIPKSCSSKTPSFAVARVARTDIGGHGKFIPLASTGEWTADLAPGFYALSTDVRFPKRTGGSTLHNGLFAILVSDTHPRGTAPIPRC
jgi:hypothetical protein